MLRNEVEKKTGLTRKALEYYEEKGLVSPKRGENQYRYYTQEDVENIIQISLLRKLGLTIEEIRKVLKDKDYKYLGSIVRDREILIEGEEKKQELLKEICNHGDMEAIKRELDLLEKKENIYKRLSHVFPGYLGQIFFSGYRPFLKDFIKNEEEEKAFQEYITFIDKLPPLELTQEEILFLEKETATFSMKDLDRIQEKKVEAIENIADWYKENQDIVEEYERFKKSEEYLTSLPYQIMIKIRKYMEENNYYEKAIPYILIFSPSYKEYYEKLLEANQKFIEFQET
ncbi:MAG: MerR family transcriptional regulator [Tissierellia bacterium]|nr:MerR family transcriptional regulator [Tissierellia bacterium]